METDPYRPPAAELADTAETGTGGSPLKAITLGLLADIGGSFFFFSAVSIVCIALIVFQKHSLQSAMLMYVDLARQTGFLIAEACFSLGFSTLGGFVSARILRRRRPAVAALQAAISALTAFFLGAGGQPDADHLLILDGGMGVLTLIAVLTGFWLGSRQHQPSITRARSSA